MATEKTNAKIDKVVYKELKKEQIDMDEETISSAIMKLINIKRKAEKLRAETSR